MKHLPAILHEGSHSSNCGALPRKPMSLTELYRRLALLIGRKERLEELEEEMRLHAELRARELESSGLTPQQAAAQAVQQFGNRTIFKESVWDIWSFTTLESAWRDVVFAVRVLRARPGFTAISVLTLALGIGATTAVFSVINTALLRDLPYRDPDRLVFLYEQLPGIPNVPLEAWGPVNGDFFTWRKQSRSFSSMAMFTTDRLNVAAPDTTFRADGSRVTGDFFRVLGVSPTLGRAVDEADTEAGNGDVVVISRALWQSRFGGNENVLGKELLLNSRPYRIIGVMPAGFAFPHGAENVDTAGTTTDLWVPWVMSPQERASRNDSQGNAIGRLRPGVTLRQAQSEIATITDRFAPPYQQQYQKAKGVVRAVDETVTGGSRRALLIFMAAVLLVLLIACSNVASLALARGIGRMQEVTVRVALGASRVRLVRQLLVESLCVALAAGLLGTAAAWAVVRLLVSFHPSNIARIEETSIDGRVLLFTLAVSLAATVLSGLFPAWSGSRCDLNDALRRSGTRSVKSGASRVRNGLLVAEMALTIVLLIASGLLIRSFLRLRSVDKGFSAESTVSMNVELYGRYNQPQKQIAFFRALLERAQAVGGIEEVAAIDHVPLGGGESITLLEVEGHPFDEKTAFESRSVTPRYFAAMGIPLLQGRAFDNGDAAGGAPAIIVSRSFERRYFPRQTAIGKHVHTSGWRTIVGVVADVRQRALDSTPPMEIYLPLWQTGARSASVVVRTALPSERVASLMRGFVRKLDTGLAVADVRTVDQLVSDASAERRFQTLVFGVFGGIALFLSLVGLYALIAWSVQQRTAEIGIRMALGAQRSAVVGLILRQGASLWVGGTALGFVCAWAVTRGMRSLLFEVQPNDPSVFVGVALLFCLVAGAACVLPARRATMVDPAIALRYE